MNKLINKILAESKSKDLREAAESDDPFFQPKDILKRVEERKNRRKKEKEKQREVLSKIELGLQNIKVAYENKKWESRREELFLQIFFKFHLQGTYNAKYKTWILLNEKNIKVGCFYVKTERLYISYNHVVKAFADEENKWSEKRWGVKKFKSFIKRMLDKYFKLNEFEIIIYGQDYDWHHYT